MTEEEFETRLFDILNKYDAKHIKAVTWQPSINHPTYPYLEGGFIDSLPSKAQPEVYELINLFLKSRN